jgi:hypothetical protein
VCRKIRNLTRLASLKIGYRQGHKSNKALAELVMSSRAFGIWGDGQRAWTGKEYSRARKRVRKAFNACYLFLSPSSVSLSDKAN